MLFSKEFIIAQQTVGTACPDCIADQMQEQYALLNTPLKCIKVNGCEYPHIDLDMYMEHYGYGEDDDSEARIRDLIARYKNGEEVYPIILDYDMEIIDGLHRYTAAYTLGMGSIAVYCPL